MRDMFNKLFRKSNSDENQDPETIKNNILSVWDTSQTLGEFPHLGTDSHWAFGRIRCCSFRSPAEWLIIMEMIVYYNGLGDFANIIYAYGNKLVKNGIQDSARFIPTSTNNYKLSEIGLHVPYTKKDWCPNPLDFEVKVNGINTSFSFKARDYTQAGIDLEMPISGERCLDHIICVLRYLVDHLSLNQLFYPTNTLLDYVGRPANIMPFMFLTEWNHPGKGTITKPSDSSCLERLAEALAYNDPSLYYCDPSLVDTHWSFWPNFLNS